jgi:GH24 family phage-related lysozyme (muramidase)
MRTPSDKALKLLKSVEELNLIPYNDKTGCAIKSWCSGATIGYGHWINVGEWPRFKDGITHEEAEVLFLQDLAPAAAAIGGNVHITLSQNQFDALLMLVFNIGVGAFKSSSLLKLINNAPGSKYPTKEQAWKAFKKNDGVDNKGLINRRSCEWDIWEKSIYNRW